MKTIGISIKLFAEADAAFEFMHLSKVKVWI
jgi:hypothetical protein